MKLIDLTSLRQRNDESVAAFIQRFRDVKNRCFSLVLSDQQIDWASKIAEVMRNQFGLKPKQRNLMYRTPYPTAYDQLPLPHKYNLPDFTKFSG